MRSVAPNGWFLGATSLLTDLSSEMVASVLPLYLVVQLGFSPLAFGALDGLYNGIGALTRMVSGVAVDRWRQPKALASAGYAVSALCRLGLLGSADAPPGNDRSSTAIAPSCPSSVKLNRWSASSRAASGQSPAASVWRTASTTSPCSANQSAARR